MTRLSSDTARAAALLLAVTILTGCSAGSFSPKSSYTDDSGNAVTVDWEDYPAHAGQDGEALLGYADQAELEPGARQLVDALRATISDVLGVGFGAGEPEGEWFDDENWHTQEGNGYGGDSLLTTVNCCDLRSDSIRNGSQWQEVLDAASATAIEAGLSEFVRDEMPEYCVHGEDQCSFRSAWATDGVQWVSLIFEDRTLDASGDAVQEAEELDLPLTSVTFGYGATVVQAGRADAYRLAIHPFIGLRRPNATTSD
jgi:hypothetical protein